MKKLYTAIMLLVLLSAPLATFAADPAIQPRLDAMLKAINAGQVWVSIPADRYGSDVESVMSMNGISRVEAIEHIAHSFVSQSAAVPAPQIPKTYQPAYDPGTHQFRQATNRAFYAGVNAKGDHVFTQEKRADMGDNFWYCQKGLTFSYGDAASSCK